MSDVELRPSHRQCLADGERSLPATLDRARHPSPRRRRPRSAGQDRHRRARQHRIMPSSITLACQPGSTTSVEWSPTIIAGAAIRWPRRSADDRSVRPRSTASRARSDSFRLGRGRFPVDGRDRWSTETRTENSTCRVASQRMTTSSHRAILLGVAKGVFGGPGESGRQECRFRFTAAPSAVIRSRSTEDRIRVESRKVGLPHVRRAAARSASHFSSAAIASIDSLEKSREQLIDTPA